MKMRAVGTSRRSFFRYSAAAGLMLSAPGFSQTKKKSADVLIVGSGPAGLSLADKLSANGVKVFVIESGVDKPTSEHQKMNTVTGDKKLIKQGLGLAGRRAVGGTSHIWGGITPRLRDSDFSTQTDYGYGLDWPISYPEISRYYCEAGAWLRNRDSLCKREVDSPFTESSKVLLHELEKLDITYSQPASMSVSQEGYFKPINLARSVAPKLKNRKSLSIIKNITVRRIEIDASGMATGVYCSNKNNAEVFIGADTVVLAGGAIQNSRLLLLSKNEQFPDGIGNSEGNVGAYFMDHPNIQYWIKPQKELISPEHNNTYVNSYHYYDQMKEAGMGSGLMRFVFFNQQWQRQKKFRHYPESDGFASADQRLMIGALCEQEPQRANRLSLDDEQFDQFGDPFAHLSFEQSERDLNTLNYIESKIKQLAGKFGDDYSLRPLRLSSHHLMGTTRMSDSDKTGVVDENQRVFGTKNLYIAGASVFSTGGAANPTLTLTALSLRLADYLLRS